MLDFARLSSGSARILYCHCAYAQAVPTAVKEGVLRGLVAAGVAFEAVPDLCALAAQRDPRLRQLAEAGAVRIVACFPRAVRSLFAAAGAELPADGVEIINMRTIEIDAAPAGGPPDESQRGSLNAVAQSMPESAAPPSEIVAAMRAAVQMGPPDKWKPWFPVIDRARCKNCRQCLSFCLFGVYGLSAEDRVEVQKPRNCKPDCPACARVCPEVAIMFPKYPGAPINGGEVRPEDLRREAMNAGAPVQLGGNLMQALRDRSAQAKVRFSKEQDENRALQERERCLEKFRTAPRSPAETASPPAADAREAHQPPPSHGE